MTIIMSTMDDPEAGKAGGDYFKAELGRQQRIAMIPYFIKKSDLVIPEDLKAKARTDDATASTLAARIDFNTQIMDGTKLDPPTVLTTENSGMIVPYLSSMEEYKDGFFFSRQDKHLSHYHEEMKYYLCKASEYKALGREPICCLKDKNEPQKLMAFVLIRYFTDPEGTVLKLADEATRPLDDKYRLDFKYEFFSWAINDSKLKVLKQHKSQFPFAYCDYIVWNEKVGKSERLFCKPTPPPAIWLKRGPVLFKKIMDEAMANEWPKAKKALGKNLSVEQIDEMFGVSAGPRKPAQEKDFSGLIS